MTVIVASTLYSGDLEHLKPAIFISYLNLSLLCSYVADGRDELNQTLVVIFFSKWKNIL